MARPERRAHPRARDAGVVVAITPSGGLTLRSASRDVAPEGTWVTDARGTFSGRVVRVFGPVERPYLSVRPRRPPRPAEGAALLGSFLTVQSAPTRGNRDAGR